MIAGRMTLKKECETLKQILESNDEVTKAAIKSNILAFRSSIEKDRKIEMMLGERSGTFDKSAQEAAKERVDYHQKKFSDVGFAFHTDTKEEDGSQK